jgi:hypothetical protein
MREYRSFEEFEREELFCPKGFTQTLDEFHGEVTLEEEDIIELWDRSDEEDEDE